MKGLSCGEVSDVCCPKLYSIVTSLYFHFGLQDLLYLHFAVGTFGNDHMRDLSSQKYVVLNSERKGSCGMFHTLAATLVMRWHGAELSYGRL